MFFEVEVVMVSTGDFAQHAHGLFGDFRTHPITRKYHYS